MYQTSCCGAQIGRTLGFMNCCGEAVTDFLSSRPQPHLALIETFSRDCFTPSKSNTGASFVVIDEGVPDIIGLEAPIFIDVRGDFERKFGAKHGSVFLTRPDGFIAFRRQGFEVGPILEASKPWACLTRSAAANDQAIRHTAICDAVDADTSARAVKAPFELLTQRNLAKS